MNRPFQTLSLLLLSVLAVSASANGANESPNNGEVRGKQLYDTCAACHASLLGEAIGPELRGVIGRRAGILPDFVYSGQMKDSGLTWDRDTLRAFLIDPQKVVPGTQMMFPGYDNVADADAVIAYLETEQ